MSMRVEKNDNGCALVLSERFDFGQVEEFRKSYESIPDVKNKTVTIDFRNTKYIDSSALGMLINAKAFFGKTETKVRITNANAQIKKIFAISRFDQKFDIS